jgi:hypothetical protein
MVRVAFRRRAAKMTICVISWLHIDELSGFYLHLNLEKLKPNAKCLSIWRKMAHTAWHLTNNQKMSSDF